MTATARQARMLDATRPDSLGFERDLRRSLAAITDRNFALLDIAAAAHDARMKAIVREIEEMWK